MAERIDRYDLTSGGILHKLLVVAGPIMGTQLVQMSYNLTDMFWLGRLSSDAVAASGTAGMYMWLSMAFVVLGRMGAEIGVSQSLGRSDREGAERFAHNALSLALLLGALFGLALVVCGGPLIGFFQIPETHVAKDAESYLSIVGLAMPFFFLDAVMVGVFNASGNSSTPFLVNICGLAANMILDPLMIFGLGLGIRGAAYATAIAQIISFSLMLAALTRSKNRPFDRFAFFVKPSGAVLRQILRWSVPVGLESMLFTLMAMITSRFVAAFGSDAIAVSRVGSQIESLSWLIGGGFGSALIAFVGQNYGAGKWTRIHKGFGISIRVMLVYGALITAVMVLLAGFLFSIFLKETTLIEMGVQYLRFTAICQIPQCFEAVSNSSFKGTGRTLPPSVVSIACNVFRVFVTYFLAQTSLRLDGIWLCISLSATLRGGWSLAWYLLARRKQSIRDCEEPLVSARSF